MVILFFNHNLYLKLDALFIGSHPDDIEITCSGTAIKLIDSGKKVGIIDLTKGELSTRGTLKSRTAETLKASKAMGIHFRENMGMQDGNIQNNLPNRNKLIKFIRELKPGIIFAPYPSDRHPDHINASNLIRESAYYSGLSKIEIDNSLPHRPNRVFYYRHAYDFNYSFIFDITDTFERKLKAIKCYSSQFYNPRIKNKNDTYISSRLFMEDITHRAAFFGFKIGVKYGEPFFCFENLKITSETIFKI
jgi:N-acetylglucosamine malate deacetylase 1